MNFRINPYDVLGLCSNATLDQINDKTNVLLGRYAGETEDETTRVILQLIQQASNELKISTISKKDRRRRGSPDTEENKAFEKEWSALIHPTPIRRSSCP